MFGYIFHVIREYHLVADISILADDFEKGANLLKDTLSPFTYCLLIETDDPSVPVGTMVIINEL